MIVYVVIASTDEHGNPNDDFLGAFTSLETARQVADDNAVPHPEHCTEYHRDISIFASHLGERVSMTRRKHGMDLKRVTEREKQEKEVALDARLKAMRDERTQKKRKERLDMAFM